MITSMPVYSGASPRGPEPQARRPALWRACGSPCGVYAKCGWVARTSKFVEGFTSNKRAGRHIEHTVFGIELVDRRAATHRVAFAEDLLKVTLKQFVATVLHNIFSWLLTAAHYRV